MTTTDTRLDSDLRFQPTVIPKPAFIDLKTYQSQIVWVENFKDPYSSNYRHQTLEEFHATNRSKK